APRLSEGVAPSIDEPERVPGTMVLWSPATSEDAGTRLAIVTALAFKERESSASSPWWDFLSIYDGEKEHALPLEPLPPLKRVPQEVPRALMPALASTAASPPLTTAPTADWSWLSSLEGIDRATRIELPVNQEAIPHIVGSKGRTIRALEDKFGVVIGVMDVPEVGALVTFLGPQVPVLWAKVAVELLARGARAALARLQWSPG
ncbi:MAG: KH domain-containing protein, partial [Spirochaetales bacterium]|nr:KH domain-containing protein [Spirochaetales bacterium]